MASRTNTLSTLSLFHLLTLRTCLMPIQSARAKRRHSKHMIGNQTEEKYFGARMGMQIRAACRPLITSESTLNPCQSMGENKARAKNRTTHFMKSQYQDDGCGSYLKDEA